MSLGVPGRFFSDPQWSILSAIWNQSERKRHAFCPDPRHRDAADAGNIHRARAGLQAQAATDLSAAKKEKKAKKAPKEEYLKAAPGTGPSGPKK